MLLDRRPCLIVGARNGDLSLTDLLLERHELNALLEDQGAWECWFKERAGGLPSPAEWTRHLRRFVYTEKFEDCEMLFCYHGCGSLTKAKISNLRLTPRIGGLTELSLICRPREFWAPHPKRQEYVEVRLDIAAVPATAREQIAYERATVGASMVSWLTPQPSASPSP